MLHFTTFRVFFFSQVPSASFGQMDVIIAVRLRDIDGISASAYKMMTFACSQRLFLETSFMPLAEAAYTSYFLGLMGFDYAKAASPLRQSPRPLEEVISISPPMATLLRPIFYLTLRVEHHRLLPLFRHSL